MPIAWVSMMARNSLLQRLRRVGCDHLDGFEQRQARLDAANDHVDGVRQRAKKVLFAAFLEKAQHPARQTETRGERQADGRPSGPPPASIAIAKQTAARMPETIMNFCGRPVQAGLREPGAQRDLLFLLAARLDFLQRAFDLFAARALASVDLAGRDRLRLGDGGAATARPFSLPTARDRQRPMPDRQWRWRRGRPTRALVSSWPAPLDRRVDFGGVERCGKPLLFTVIARAIPEARPSDAGRAMSPDNRARWRPRRPCRKGTGPG